MSSTVQCLPVELLCEIMLYLSTRNIFTVQSVSKHFESAVTDKYLWFMRFADYSFEEMNHSLQLARKITLALQTPVRIYDCYSTKIIITTKNDVLFDEPPKFHIYDGNKIIDFNNDRHALCFYGEYYRNYTNRTVNNLYTGEIYDYSAQPYFSNMIVGTDNDVLLKCYRCDYDSSRIISVIDMDNNLIYKTIRDKLSKNFIIKKDRNLILFYNISVANTHIKVYDISAQKNIYKKSQIRTSCIFEQSVRFNYPFIIFVIIVENGLNSTMSVEVLNLKTDNIKIIYEIQLPCNLKIGYNTSFNFTLSEVINGNLFFNFHDSSESNILFHYNVYMEEYLAKYQMGSKLSAFDINLNVLATCQNNSIQVYNLC